MIIYTLPMEKLRHRICPRILVSDGPKIQTQVCINKCIQQIFKNVVYEHKSWILCKEQISFSVFFILQFLWILIRFHTRSITRCFGKMDLILLKKILQLNNRWNALLVWLF